MPIRQKFLAGSATAVLAVMLLAGCSSDNSSKQASTTASTAKPGSADSKPASDAGNTAGNGSGNESGGGNGTGGGKPSTTTKLTSSTSTPTGLTVGSISASPTIKCGAGATTVTVTVKYAATGKYIEYLAPGSDRPGAEPSTGAHDFLYDCKVASMTFKIRTFNEFNGSDGKDPSSYKEVTVTRESSGATGTTKK